MYGGWLCSGQHMRSRGPLDLRTPNCKSKTKCKGKNTITKDSKKSNPSRGAFRKITSQGRLVDTGLGAAHHPHPSQQHPDFLEKHCFLPPRNLKIGALEFSPENRGVSIMSDAPAGRTPWASCFLGFGGDWLIFQPSHQFPGASRSCQEIPFSLSGTRAVLLTFSQRSRTLCGCPGIFLHRKLRGRMAAWHPLCLNFTQGMETSCFSWLCCLKPDPRPLQSPCLKASTNEGTPSPQTSLPTAAGSPPPQAYSHTESISDCRFKAPSHCFCRYALC